MSEPLHPLRRAADARRPRRRASDNAAPAEHATAAESRTLPIVVEPIHANDPPPHRSTPEATYAAHLLGQKDARRGLRGGQETLEAARSAYLGAEYSGVQDRRPNKGLIRKTEI